MMRFVTTLSLLGLVACATTGDPTNEASSRLAGTGQGRYVVVFKSSTLPADAASRVQKAGGAGAVAVSEVGVMTASGDAAFASKMAKDSAVLAVGPEQGFSQPDMIAGEAIDEEATADAFPTPSSDPYYYIYQWDMRRVGAPAVWARLPLATNGRKATVAVLDVGVADNHSDLVGQVCGMKATSYCQTPGGPNNSASYPKYGSLIDFDAHPSWSPSDGCTAVPATYEAHGTHVAGTIAAKIGGGRAVGVDPDACVAAYKVFDRYRYTDAAGLHDAVGAFDGPLYAAIVDAANNHIPVISMSLGSVMQHQGKDGAASWKAWNRVLDYANRAGTLVVASAGNDGINVNGTLAHVPGDISTVVNTSASGWSQLVLVGGTYQFAPGSHDVLAFYSDYGSAVDLTAPGGDCGPDPNGCFAQYLILNDYVFPDGRLGYAFFAGTSMATPHVSAVAAMVRALHPELGPGDVRSFLKEHAEPLGDRQAFGHGMCNADLATQ
jgi:lantibiotic leader peptide-processing serine protease